MNRLYDSPIWKLYLDTGGTFTDCIGLDPKDNEHRCKVLSNSAIRGTCIEQTGPGSIRVRMDYQLPDHFFNGLSFHWLTQPGKRLTVTGFQSEDHILHLTGNVTIPDNNNHTFELRSTSEAPIFAARIMTRSPFGQPLPPLHMRLATTKGTNALLERKGAVSVLFITKGFKDLLLIGDQQRPDLFALQVQKSLPFYQNVIEVPERISSEGEVLNPFHSQAFMEEIESRLSGMESAAICLMNSYTNPEHEELLAELLAKRGIRHISVSSKLSRKIKIVPRARTTDVNAYLSPIMETYLQNVGQHVVNGNILVMTSAGGLVRSDFYAPKDGLLSGPAGGVTGAVSIGGQCGFSKLITLDMGGTSTDVARYDHEFDYIPEHKVGDALLQSNALAVETVAAGGGSICGFDGESLTVGPESAGADPGPACYGAGGPLTITDINLLSGRLDPDGFHFPVQIEAAEKAFEDVIGFITDRKGDRVDRNSILEGFLDIANERMVQAILKISLEKGFDPSEYTLVAFGGAGGQHATAVAGKLGIDTVLIPADAGLLSAYGLKQARMELIETEQLLMALDEVLISLPERFKALTDSAKNQLMREGVNEESLDVRRTSVFVRLQGQESTLELEYTEPASIQDRFIKAYRKTYGHWIEDRDIEVESLRVIVSEKMLHRTEQKETHPETHPKPIKNRPLLYGNSQQKVNIWNRKDLEPGSVIHKPALIPDAYSTTFIEPGWSGFVHTNGTLVLSSQSSVSPSQTTSHETEHNDVVKLQLYTNRFTSVAEQMGEMLRRTSISVNVRERLDFSCALLDANGYLVVNAPHIPIHLGAMGTCVRTLMDQMDMDQGDVVITNHPGFGGSHLPDVTVVSPVHYQNKRIGFVASRAHHAEIGGKSPGSMPPDAKNLLEEGVVIPPTYLIRNGTEYWQKIRNLMTKGPWPTRSIEENMADLQAAVAANHRGAAELVKLASQFGSDEIILYMNKIRKYASERLLLTLQKLNDDVYEADEQLDDGSLLSVHCTIQKNKLTIDFTGTRDIHPGNLNANPSIVRSVIMYVLRLLINEPLPLNDGLLDPVSIHLPECMLNPFFPENPEDCPAVVGGNIETSQRLVDTFIKAFGLAACSQGTMNNVLFGNERFGYYETVAGGTGAGNGFHGADAVHQHMTNTRATDPEVLEHRYPVRLDRYEIRNGSGGQGAWNGGNGLIREMTFLEPVRLSVLTQHRIVAPYGQHGGAPGKKGFHGIQKKDGSTQDLEWKDGADLQAGDKFILHTPGGGAWGSVHGE